MAANHYSFNLTPAYLADFESEKQQIQQAKINNIKSLQSSLELFQKRHNNKVLFQKDRNNKRLLVHLPVADQMTVLEKNCFEGHGLKLVNIEETKKGTKYTFQSIEK